MLVFFWLFFWAWFLGKLVTYVTNRIEKKRKILWPDYEDRAWQAQSFLWSMWDKIQEMERDPFTSEADWKKLLPICKYADEWFKQTHPHMNFLSREKIVKSMMD
jgi:hypothetical protein